MPTPTPAAFGDFLEGGYYAGMLWNELTQTGTSATLSGGVKVFTTTTDMHLTPLVYVGQQLEIRSRSNPSNHFKCTVLSAAGTELTVNVTAISGSGTFSNWSVMSRYRQIVAPKASGERDSIELSSFNTALPTACQTLTEGLRATDAMAAAGPSSTYPAAHWARNLDIGGYTDWHIPARDALELLWRNLKPVTANNAVSTPRGVSSVNYANNGSYGDTSTAQGFNNNSSPMGVAYTTTEPAQTAATAFRTGGSEALIHSTAYYGSCSEYAAGSVWVQFWGASIPGFQGGGSNRGKNALRAVRRSIV